MPTTQLTCLAVYHAVAPMDYVSVSYQLLEFEVCDTRRCLNITINNDMTLEKAESFGVAVYLSGVAVTGRFFGEIKIMDDNEGKNLYT